VEPAIGGIFILSKAVGAHGEAGHGGLGAIVGNIEDDAVARAAVGAVGEGVLVAAIRGISRLCKADIAHRDVRRDGGKDDLPGATGADLESRLSGGWKLLEKNLRDVYQRRRLQWQRISKGPNRDGCTFRLDDDPVTGIEHKAGKLMPTSQLMDIGAKAYPLNYPADLESNALDGDGNSIGAVEKFIHGRLQRHRPQENPPISLRPEEIFSRLMWGNHEL
jgi:hypothetical protein